MWEQLRADWVEEEQEDAENIEEGNGEGGKAKGEKEGQE